MNKSVYTRPDKPSTMIVRNRRIQLEAPAVALPEIVEVDRFTECFVTPDDVAARMVDYLGPVGDYLTLEPQAGTGNLLNALFNAGHSAFETVAVERSNSLYCHIQKRFSNRVGFGLHNRCFLEYADEAKRNGPEFPRIIMNPPFRSVKQHMKAALSLFGHGGHDSASMVALVPVTFDHESIGMELLETLSNDVFEGISVSTKIVGKFI